MLVGCQKKGFMPVLLHILPPAMESSQKVTPNHRSYFVQLEEREITILLVPLHPNLEKLHHP